MLPKKNNSVPTWWSQKSFNEFKTEYFKSKKGILLFIGSGISRWMNLPDWKGLLLSLAEYYDQSNTSKDLVAKVKTLLADVKNDSVKHEEIGSFIKQTFNSRDRHLWREALTHILDNPEIINSPSDIHNTIAKLNWFRIVTPNYDQLIEQAIRKTNQSIDKANQAIDETNKGTEESIEKLKDFIVTHPWKNPNNVAFIENCTNPCIFKIHGDITDRKSEIVLTKEDYEELYGVDVRSDPMLTKEDYEELHDVDERSDPIKFKRTLGSVLRSAEAILYMGYSHDDPYLKKLYKNSMIRAKRENVFALVERSGEEGFGKKINELSEELKIKFITYSPDAKHSELLEFLNYFVQSQEAAEATDKHYQKLSKIKKPTIIMLHCGGTISSIHKTPFDKPLSVVIKKSRHDKELAEFSAKLLSWYKDSYNSGNDLQIDLIWEILPEEFQMFSENATPKLWNAVRKKIEDIIFKYFHAPEIPENEENINRPRLEALFKEERRQYSIFVEENYGVSPETLDEDQRELSYKCFSSEFKNRYILGVIILFGTDTLAYLAPALSFGLQQLPCPIIITGANQSPQETGVLPKGRDEVTSDTWKNLKMSMYFLQCFGHRTREIFVCFGNTIHNCINLRKRAMEIVPSGHASISEASREPFTYRNVFPHYQYMFKFIDGIFCNGYYTNYSKMLSEDVKDTVRHIRFDALEATPYNTTIGEDYYPVIQHVDVNPCFPLINVKGALSIGKGRDKLRAYLVEGYPSGTYPTTEDNNFSRLLTELYNKRIPVILVSRYGILATQQKYETIPLLKGVVMPVLSLYGIIAETALPLISMVIGKIPDHKWHVQGGHKKVLTYRKELIKRELAEFFRSRPNIISDALQYIIEKDEMNSQIEAHYKLLERTDHTRKNNLDNKRRISLPWVAEMRENHPASFVVMSHNDFKLLLNEFVRTFERVGSGADGFEILYNLGFDIGIPLFKSFAASGDKSYGGSTLFYQRSFDEREGLVKMVNDRLEEVAKLLTNSGIADVSISSKMETTLVKLPEIDNSFSFEVSIKRYGKKKRKGEKYAVRTFTDEEAKFFKNLSYGCGDQQKIDSFIGELQELYTNLLDGTWRNYARSVDWLILGIYKSIACDIAEDLRFDKMALDSVISEGVLNSLREAVKVNIKAGDENWFTVQFSYFEDESL